MQRKLTEEELRALYPSNIFYKDDIFGLVHSMHPSRLYLVLPSDEFYVRANTKVWDPFEMLHTHGDFWESFLHLPSTAFPISYLFGHFQTLRYEMGVKSGYGTAGALKPFFFVADLQDDTKSVDILLRVSWDAYEGLHGHKWQPILQRYFPPYSREIRLAYTQAVPEDETLMRGDYYFVLQDVAHDHRMRRLWSWHRSRVWDALNESDQLITCTETAMLDYKRQLQELIVPLDTVPEWLKKWGTETLELNYAPYLESEIQMFMTRLFRYSAQGVEDCRQFMRSWNQLCEQLADAKAERVLAEIRQQETNQSSNLTT